MEGYRGLGAQGFPKLGVLVGVCVKRIIVF